MDEDYPMIPMRNIILEYNYKNLYFKQFNIPIIVWFNF